MSRTPPGRLRPSLAVLAVGLLVGAAAGCGSGTSALRGKVIKDGVACKSKVDRQADAPSVPTGVKVAKKVTTTDAKKGTGCAISAGAAASYVSMDLIGATASEGKVFTSTWKTKHPITIMPGQGQLIAGLETGLKAMKVGGQRTIVVPSALAYGKDGNAAQGIGANQDLVFVVELLAVADTSPYCGTAQVKPGANGKPVPGKPTEVDMPVNAPTKLNTADVKQGTGKVVAKGNYVTLNYLLLNCPTGAEIESSWGKAPASFTVGQGTIEGFGNGLIGMKKGGQRRIEIPWELGYGAAGQPPTIGPKLPLVFVIEIITLADKAPATTVPSTDSAPPPPQGATSSTTAASGQSTSTTAGGGSTTTTVGDTTTTAKSK